MAAGAAMLLLGPPLADFTTWSLWRQALQRRADGAALEGVRALESGDPEAAVRARLTGLALAEPPVVEHPPRNGAYAGRPDAVRVSLAAVRSPFFHSLLFGPSLMRASATAALITFRDGGAQAVRVE